MNKHLIESNNSMRHLTLFVSLFVLFTTKTLGRSGEAVFARDDTPEKAAYDLAKAIDENHGELKWFIRVYSYDPKTVWQNFGVPLHPGAENYYREAGYLK